MKYFFLFLILLVSNLLIPLFADITIVVDDGISVRKDFYKENKIAMDEDSVRTIFDLDRQLITTIYFPHKIYSQASLEKYQRQVVDFMEKSFKKKIRKLANESEQTEDFIFENVKTSLAKEFYGLETQYKIDQFSGEWISGYFCDLYRIKDQNNSFVAEYIVSDDVKKSIQKCIRIDKMEKMVNEIDFIYNLWIQKLMQLDSLPESNLQKVEKKIQLKGFIIDSSEETTHRDYKNEISILDSSINDSIFEIPENFLKIEVSGLLIILEKRLEILPVNNR